MAITAQQFREVVGRAVGPLVGLADLPAAAYVALAMRGRASAAPDALTDADLRDLPAADLPAVLDIAQWRAMETVLDNLTEESLREAGVSEDVDRVAARLRQRTDRLAARVKAAYGVGQPTLRVGILDIGGIQTHDPTDPPTWR